MDRRGFLTLGVRSAFLAVAVTTGLNRVSLATLAGPITAGRTLIDFAKGDDRIGIIIATLAETNEVLQGISFVESVQPTGHRAVIRSRLPSTAWRLLNRKSL